jgi:polyisoprenyl-phosphate glycosyltransferase
LTELSVVIPVYRCRDCLPELHRRLTEALESVSGDVEIVFVEDGGADGSWEVLSELATRDPRVKAYRLSRNFGQHAAITAGLSKATGRWVVVMDCDLQDPPEIIPRLWAKAQEGYDVVFGKRAARTHSVVRRLAAKAYFRFLRSILGVQISGNFGAFTLISRRAREAVLSMPDVDRHYVPMLLWVGYEQAAVEYDLEQRYAGESSYSFSALVRLAVTGVLFQTTSLLRWIIYAGISLALAGFAVAGFLIVSYYFITPYPGWTSLVVVILVTSGFVALSTGVTGLYVGNVFRQVKGRPLYLVESEYRAGTEIHAQSGPFEREVQS